jgi:hypothetical protein
MIRPWSLHSSTDLLFVIRGPPGLITQTAHNAEELRTSISSGASAIFLIGDAPGTIEWSTVNQTTALGNYTITAGLGFPLATARVIEYFTYGSAGDCNISRIDATFYIGQS